MPIETGETVDQAGTSQEVSTTKIVKGKLVASFKYPTPIWATYIFRIEFIINKCLMMFYAGTSMHVENVKEKILYLTVIDFGVWMFAKSIGVKKEDLGLEDS